VETQADISFMQNKPRFLKFLERERMAKPGRFSARRKSIALPIHYGLIWPSVLKSKPYSIPPSRQTAEAGVRAR